MYALFTAIPLLGHINPLLRQAEALRRRGWRVAFAGASEVEAHVAAEVPDVPFVDLGPLGSITDDLRRAQAAASADPDFSRGTRRIIDSLWVLWGPMFDGLRTAIQADQPDVVVVDIFSSAGMSAADAAGIPFVVNNPDLLAAISVKLLPPADHLPFLFSGRSAKEVRWRHRAIAPLLRRLAIVVVHLTVGRRLNGVRASRGLPPIDVHEMLRGRTVLVNGVFGLEYPRPLPDGVSMVGPMLPPTSEPLPADLAGWLEFGPPVVYVNLGTIAAPSTSQLSRIHEALRRLSLRALWVLRGPHSTELPGSAAIRLETWGPAPAAILAHPNVRVFVSHCGINSVHESIWAGTPIVGLPMFADQRDMAARVADAGVGVWLDKHRFTAGELADAIERVAEEPSFRTAIPPLQAAIARAGGAGRAADLIERAIARDAKES